MSRYPVEVLNVNDDDGTMPENLSVLSQAVIGHRIVKVERGECPGQWGHPADGHIITLDDGRQVRLADTGDCCAYTELQAFLLHPEAVDHVITGVGTTGEFTTWHIFADFGDVLELTVEWSCGNPFFYSYGFHITVVEVDGAAS